MVSDMSILIIHFQAEKKTMSQHSTDTLQSGLLVKDWGDQDSNPVQP